MSIHIPINNDCDEIPVIPTEQHCQSCGGLMGLWQAEHKNYTDAMGYMHTRLRIRYRCSKCKNTVSYRIGTILVKDGNFLKEEDVFLENL